jgi:chromosome partitioning protein
LGQVIALANQKGGVAKTTTTLNLGVALAERGKRVLAVDLDPQSNLTMSQGIDPDDLERSMFDVLVHKTPIEDIIVQREVDLAVASIDLAGAELAMSSMIGRERALQKALLPLRSTYEYVLVDTPPSLGLLTINALACAERILIPLACEFFSLRGVALLMDTVDKVQDRLNPDLKIIGILATMFDPRTMHAREVRNRVIEAFGDLVFDAVINRTVRFPETTVAGEPITTWAPTSNGAQAYRLLAREVLAR